jgi:hypothetical protein
MTNHTQDQDRAKCVCMIWWENMMENKIWIKKILLLCACAFPRKYPLIFIEGVVASFSFF